MTFFTVPTELSEELLNQTIKKYRYLNNPNLDTLERLVAYYLRVMYPNIVFRVDLMEEFKNKEKLYIKQSDKKPFPTLFICEPKGDFSGAFIEMKCETENIFDSSGKLKTDRLKEEKKVLDVLYAKGYYTAFGLGFSGTVDVLNSYLRFSNKVR